MKVKFLKDHLRHRAGEVSDIIDDAANYFIKCNVAIPYVEEPKPEAPKKTAPKKKGK